MPAATTVVLSGASDTALETANNGAPNGVNNLILAGKNIPTWVASTNEAPEDYVTTFAQITAGTAGSAAVAAKLTNRTGW